MGPGSPRRILRGCAPPHGRGGTCRWEAAHSGALVAGHPGDRPAAHAGIRAAVARRRARSCLGRRRRARSRRGPVGGARGRAVQRRDGHDPGGRRPAPPQRGFVSDIALYRRLLRQARPYWPHLAGLFAIGLLASPLALLDPVPLKIVFDSVLGAHPLPAYLAAALPAATTRSAATLLAVAIGLLIAVAALAQVQG